MRARHLFFAAAVLISTWGCGGSVTARGIAQIRAISAVTNPTAIDVFTDFNIVAIGLTNGSGAGYGSQPATLLSVGVRQTGTTASIASGNIQAEVGGKYSLIPYQTGTSTVGILALDDSVSAPGAVKFKVRLVHVDRNVGLVDLYFVDPDADLSESTPVLTNVNYQTATGYVELDAGIQKEIVVTQAGTTNVIGNIISATPSSGAVHTLMLLDHSGPALNIYND